jgi:hypothetical protein
VWPAITDYIANRVSLLRRAAPSESLLHGVATDRRVRCQRRCQPGVRTSQLLTV